MSGGDNNDEQDAALLRKRWEESDNDADSLARRILAQKQQRQQQQRSLKKRKQSIFEEEEDDEEEKEAAPAESRENNDDHDNASVYSDELDEQRHSAQAQRHRQQPRRERRDNGSKWAFVPNFMRSDAELDEFLTRVYQYYVHGGLAAFIVDRLGQVIKIVFIGSIALFLLGFVDYGALWTALQDDTKGASGVSFGSFLAYRGVSVWYWPFFVALAVYLVSTVVEAIKSVRAMLPIRDYYRYVLGVRHIATIEWATVVERLAASDEIRKRCSSNSEDEQFGGEREVSELHVVSRITRRQNYIVALVNCDALALKPDERSVLTEAWNPLMARSTPSGLPDQWLDDDAYYYDRRTAEPLHPVLTRTLQFALERTLFEFAFEAKRGGALRPELARMTTLTARLDPLNPPEKVATENNSSSSDNNNVVGEENDVLRSLGAALAKKYRVAAVVGILLSPFVLAFLIADFFLQHGESFRNRPSSLLGLRHWSNEAKWLFRDFNELDHFFRRRLARAYEPALNYASNFSSPTLAALARTLEFVVGALLTLLVLLALAWSDDALTRLDVAFGRSALWWMGLLAALLAGLRAFSSSSSSTAGSSAEARVFDPAAHLRATAKCTHYMPRAWHGNEQSAVVRDDFFRLFGLRFYLYLRELLSVLFTPYLLFFVLPERATDSLRFLVQNTDYVAGVGYVCRFASLRLARDGDSSFATTNDQENATATEKEDSSFGGGGGRGGGGAKYGKMEASHANFSGHYRRWRPEPRDVELGQVKRKDDGKDDDDEWVEEAIKTIYKL